VWGPDWARSQDTRAIDPACGTPSTPPGGPVTGSVVADATGAVPETVAHGFRLQAAVTALSFTKPVVMVQRHRGNPSHLLEESQPIVVGRCRQAGVLPVTFG
jgi:hypothetical protein